MPTSSLPTPMDTTPSPNVFSSLPNTHTMQHMQVGNVIQASTAAPTVPTIPAAPIQCKYKSLHIKSVFHILNPSTIFLNAGI